MGCACETVNLALTWWHDRSVTTQEESLSAAQRACRRGDSRTRGAVQKRGSQPDCVGLSDRGIPKSDQQETARQDTIHPDRAGADRGVLRSRCGRASGRAKKTLSPGHTSQSDYPPAWRPPAHPDRSLTRWLKSRAAYIWSTLRP